MTTQEDARKAMAKARQDDKNTHQTMLSRSEAEIENSLQSEIDQESRELMVEQRRHERNLKDSILSRSEAEISNTES